MKATQLFTISLLALNLSQAHAQGCSDPGHSTIGSLQPMHVDTLESRLKLTAGYRFGRGEMNVRVNQFVGEIDYRFSQEFTFSAQIPYVMTEGTLGSANGLGDMVFGLSWKRTDSLFKYSGTLSSRLVTGFDNRQFEGQNLPLIYQTSLGQGDITVSSGIEYKLWKLAVGYSKPFGHSSNPYFNEQGTVDRSDSLYWSSNKLKRGSDLSIRFSKGWNLKKIDLYAGALGFIRLEKDSYVNKNKERVKIDGSTGLTLNVSLGASYKISDNIRFHVNLGRPVIARPIHADGTLRSIQINTGLSFYL